MKRQLHTPRRVIQFGVVAEDFNRDGHIDLAMADTAGNDVYVMLGNGDGTFKAGTSFTAGQVAFELVAGDFNGDGLLDLHWSWIDQIADALTCPSCSATATAPSKPPRRHRFTT